MKSKIFLDLIKFAKHADDWDELATSQEGIYFQKMPKKNKQLLLNISIKKFPTARKGKSIKNRDLLNSYKNIINVANIKETIIDVFKNKKQDLINIDTWKLKSTRIRGVYYTKTPNSEDPVICLIPVDENGQEIQNKKRYLYINNLEEFSKYRDIINNPKLESALVVLEDINREYVMHLELYGINGLEKFFEKYT